MLTILHASDLHFGRHFIPARARELTSFVRSVAPDLLVLSGDFTQRAKVREYEQARAFLAGLPELPTVVTPGNHDVPLYRVWERIGAPLRNYRTYIRDVLDECVSVPGATVVALNSTAPWRAITNGRLDRAQLDFACRAFADAPAGDVRILVTHHHLGSAPDYLRDSPLPRRTAILRQLEDAGVDLVLGGHIHRACAQRSTDLASGEGQRRPVVVVQAGTTTSARGRAAEKRRNSLNVVRVGEDTIEVTHHLDAEATDSTFRPVRTTVFGRAGRALAGGLGSAARAAGAASSALLLAGAIGAGAAAPVSAQAEFSDLEIGSVSFQGNTAIDSRVLARRIVTRPTSCISTVLTPFCWLSFDFAQDPSYFSRRVLNQDLARVSFLYIDEGFREVQVDTATTLNADGQVLVTFTIEEGEPTLIGSIDYFGGEGDALDRLFEELPVAEGDRLSRSLLDETRRTLLQRLWGAGYAQAEVLREQFIPRDDPYTAEVGFDIQRGPRVRFGGILVDQTETLDPGVVRRMIPIESGQYYDPEAIFDAQRNLYQLELVNYAAVDTVANPASDTLLDVRVRVTEGDLRRVRTGGGWSTAECFSSEASWTHRNLVGGARRLQVRGRLSNVAAESLGGSICPQAGTDEFGKLNWLVSTDFSQPWFFSPRNTLNASLFAERQSLQDVFVRRAFGATIGLSRRIGRTGTLTLNYRPQLSELEAAEIFFCTSVLVCDPAQIEVLQGYNWLSPIELAYSQDRRDQVLNPRSGHFWVVNLGHASSLTGSEFRYHRVAGEVAGYAPVGDFVFAAHLRGGWLGQGEFRELGSGAQAVEIVPPQVRLFAGGANSVRGFPQNRLGPRVLTVAVESLVGERSGEAPACSAEEVSLLVCDAGPLDDAAFDVRPTGGTLLVEGSVETRFPIGSSAFEGAIFLDWGQVWEEADGFSLGTMELAPGLGVRYQTPIGPIRVDLGYRFRGQERLRVVTSQVRPFDPASDDPSDRLTGAGGAPIEWVRTDELAPLDPRVLFGQSDLWSFGRLQLHFSIGQAY